MRTRVAILAAAFNEGVVGTMIREATAEVEERGGVVVETLRVPGAYELPLPAKLLLERADVDLVVALGFIEKGETLHGAVMGQVVHGALVDLQLQYKKPVGIGIIGPGATDAQAEARKEAYARAAVSAGLAQWAVLEQASERKPSA